MIYSERFLTLAEGNTILTVVRCSWHVDEMAKTLLVFFKSTCHIIMSVLGLVFSLIAHGYSLSNVTEDSASAKLTTGPISSVMTTAKIIPEKRNHFHAEMLMVQESGKVYRTFILRQHDMKQMIRYS